MRGVGHWQSAAVSPDGTRLLLTWSAECESPSAHLAPGSGGEPVAATGQRDWTEEPESVGLGWTSDGRALVYRRYRHLYSREIQDAGSALDAFLAQSASGHRVVRNDG